MSEIVKMTVYPFEELEEAARERAREWYRSLGDPEDWHACVLEDFTEVCERLGVRLRTHRVKLFGGGTREEPNVYFQGFGSQGDGACFEGEYTFVEDDVRTYAPPRPGAARDRRGPCAGAARERMRAARPGSPADPGLLDGSRRRARGRSHDDAGDRRHGGQGVAGTRTLAVPQTRTRARVASPRRGRGRRAESQRVEVHLRR